ncbi:MAG: SpvB/TcaC N-terminal domain-containing protein [Cyanobacteria bacterium J06621_8]
MSNKSGTSSQVISLPQGGGALSGIGEKFAPDLHTGTGNFTVPMTLPSGRNGFQPEINLVYSTGNGNSAFGQGWNLSLPGVMRKTSDGIPRYNQEDTFVISGAEDLVPVAQAGGVTSYRPRTEGLFARIEHRQQQQLDYWKVWSKDGLVSYYGNERSPDEKAILSNPQRQAEIFCWKLTKTQDTHGNQIVYEYDRVLAQENVHQGVQLYLKSIKYGDYAADKYLVEVSFEYELRPDPFSEYRGGFEIRTDRRCTKISVSTNTEVKTLVRTYELIYLDTLTQELPLNNVSLLKQVKVIGHDASETEELPPLEFGYTQFNPQGRKFFALPSNNLPTRSLDSPDLELADLFGNGMPDILQMNGTVRYWRNQGNGKFDPPRPMNQAPAGVNLADRGVQMLDANGDGRIDLMVTTGAIAGYYATRPEGLWDRKAFQPYDFAPSFNLEDPEVQLIDLDGDGVTDAIRSGTRLECFFNHPQQGWYETKTVARGNIKDFPNVNFSDSRVKWGDMSGDGMQDIVLVHDGNVEYYPNLGYGRWGKRLRMKNSPRFRYGYDPRRILLGDVDGDGLTDIVYVDDRQVILWINQQGARWSEPVVIKGTPPVTDLDGVRLEDLLGSGIKGVLWSNNLRGTRSHYYFLDFTGGVKPYVLDEMNNNLGSRTKVGYAPSTKFYLEDEQQKQTRWKTNLPFPVQVVAKVEVIDELSGGKLTTQYRYHHGYWDGGEREFRGFGMVEQLDTETFSLHNQSGLQGERKFNAVAAANYTPPILTKTWFHQGAVGDEFGDWYELDYTDEYWSGDRLALLRPPEMVEAIKQLPRRVKRDAFRAMRGQVLRTEVYALDSTAREERPYTVTESLPGVREEFVPNLRNVALPSSQSVRHIFFAFGIAQRTTQWERGNEPMTQYAFTGDYDAYGQMRSQIAIAVPRKPGETYLATYAVTEYAQKDTAETYIVDRVSQATSYEIINDGSMSVAQLQQAIAEQTASREIIAQSFNYYDGSAFEGLALGQIGDRGALMRTESLVLTEDILRSAYQENNATIPPYLNPNGVNWTGEYPQEFRDSLADLAGYSYRNGNYYVTTQRSQYDFQANPQGKGLVLTMRDPLGRDTEITYDRYQMLPITVTDILGLTTTASYDYRVLQPNSVSDPNGNQQQFGFTPLGLPQWAAMIDPNGAGDTPDSPSQRFEYDFLAFVRARQPMGVRTITREHHVNEIDVLANEKDNTIEAVEYSDGFGRLLQTRSQSEDVRFGNATFGTGVTAETKVTGRIRQNSDPANVVVSGWQVYDNKGQVVRQYEPFYATGWDYQTPQDSERGQAVEMFYDPRGQVIRTVNPDNSEQLVIYGIPQDIENPDSYQPTPWEAYTYDANDNGGRTHPQTATAYGEHWHTPASVEIDALGRTIKAVERNGSNPNTDWYITRSSYDIRGNLLTVIDALGRLSFRYSYDLGNNPLQITNVDAGIRRMVMDALGREIERRDSKGALILQTYDEGNRPSEVWTRDNNSARMRLIQKLVYGDRTNQLTLDTARQLNLLGQVYLQFDEAGRTTFSSYDFKGNFLEKSRQVISDSTILNGGVDWQNLTTNPLGATEYKTSATYDALNRIKTMVYPEDVQGDRQVLKPEYNRAGGLDKVTLNGTTYVEHLAYDAKGQRSLIVYGNGVMTRYQYDSETFRLVRLLTQKYQTDAPFSYQPQGAPLQDLRYQYDLVGNITSIQDYTPGSGVAENIESLSVNDPELATLLQQGNALIRRFSYDPLYRLTSATGRQSNNISQPRPWTDEQRQGYGSGRHGTATQENAPTMTTLYQERYQYDPAGNMTQLEHQNLAAANTWQTAWTRNFGMAGFTPQQWQQQWQANLNGNWQNPPGNKLTHVEDRRAGVNSPVQVAQTHRFDVNGNLIQENQSRFFEWNHNDQLWKFTIQAGNGNPSVEAYYIYDAGGERVKKLVKKGSQTEVTIYIDGIFEHHIQTTPGATKENNTLHVMDDSQRIVLIRVGEPFDNNVQTPAVQYHLGDHLGSSAIALDAAGAWVNREEYFPYGETSFGSFGKKRYRYTGKERDEESGLNYHSARYYAPWLMRWISCDPIGLKGGLNLYCYVENTPVKLIDSNGMEGEEKKDDKKQEMTTEPSSKPLLPLIFGVAHVGPYVRNPAINQSNLTLRFHANVGHKAMLSATRFNRKLAERAIRILDIYYLAAITGPIGFIGAAFGAGTNITMQAKEHGKDFSKYNYSSIEADAAFGVLSYYVSIAVFKAFPAPVFNKPKSFKTWRNLTAQIAIFIFYGQMLGAARASISNTDKTKTQLAQHTEGILQGIKRGAIDSFLSSDKGKKLYPEGYSDWRVQVSSKVIGFLIKIAVRDVFGVVPKNTSKAEESAKDSTKK